MRSVIVLASILLAGSATAQTDCNDGWLRSQAIQEIEYLRRAYAYATDRIGSDIDGDVEAGRRVYRHIFTDDAAIRASGLEGTTTGPDTWVEVVRDALGPMGPTQHLIGTQLVEVEALALDEACRIESGRARMDSHLQAWHTRADGKVWVFVGTYRDEVVFSPETGWQIAAMNLERTAEEVR